MNSILNIKNLYIERSVFNLSRTKEIISKFPGARQIFVDSHWKIPQLHGNEENVEIWNRIKRETLVVGKKSAINCRPNGRSTDYVAPSHSNGCALSCVYCYVARRKGYANPVTVFANINDIQAEIKSQASRLGTKIANQCDPLYWTFDIGENSDCSVDDYISSNVKDLISLFKTLPNAKASFATKFVNTDLLNYDPQGKTRIRFSLMPSDISKVVDVRTSSISDRIKAINSFVDAGYEVHVNLSPVIVYEGWTKDWDNLFQELKDNLSDKSLAQLKSEVIFLTHNKELHQINTKWHPKAEEFLWTPDWQEEKVSETGGENLRYKYDLKYKMIDMFKNVYKKHFNLNTIRYCF